MLPIKDIMTKHVYTVGPNESIVDALHLLSKKGISGLPVIDEDKKVVGILTEHDVLKILIGDKIPQGKRIADYMKRDVYCFQEDVGAIEVCKFFLKHAIRRVPVTRDGKLVGIVSRHDLVSLIIEADEVLSDLRVA